MSPSPNTFIVAPVRYAASLASRPKSAMIKVAETLDASAVSAPTASDKIGLWLCLQEWANRNLAALEGLRAGHAAGSGAMARGAVADAMAHGGEGTDG